jgi:hypothetical protein
VAVDQTQKLIVVSFRGTNSVKNLEAILNFGLTSTGLPATCKGCTAHGGFIQGWLDAKSMVVAAINATSAAHPASAGYKILVTGHSLGAGISSVAVVDLRGTFPAYAVDLVCLTRAHSNPISPAAVTS